MTNKEVEEMLRQLSHVSASWMQMGGISQETNDLMRQVTRDINQFVGYHLRKLKKEEKENE